MDSKERAAFWEQYYLESPIRDIEVIDSAARQLITVTALLQGLYFAAISLSDFKRYAAAWQLALLLTPAVLWLLSLVFAVMTFMPIARRISRESVRDDFVRIVHEKFRNLRLSYYGLLLSLAVLLANVLVYLLWIARATSISPLP